MKKYYVISLVILIVCLFYFSYASFYPLINQKQESKKEIHETAEIINANPSNINTNALDYIDFTYKDLDLTSEELKIIKKYQQNGQVLKYGNSEKHMYNETYAYKGQDYKIGLGRLNIEAIEKVFGIEINEVTSQTKNSAEMVSSSEADFVSGVFCSEELEETGNLLSVSTSSEAIYYYTSEEKKLDTYEDWDGLTIGIIKSKFYFPEEKVEEFKEQGANVTIKEYDSYLQVIPDLLNGEIDGIIEVFNSYALKYGYKAVEITKYYQENNESIYYNNSNEDIDILMSAIQKMYTYNGKMQGAIDKFTEMYAYMQFSLGYCFSDEEREFIKLTEDEPLKMFVPLSYSPHSSYNEETGEFTGALYESWDQIAKIANIKYEAIIPEKVVFDDVLKGLTEKEELQLDGMVAIRYTNGRNEYLNFVNAVYRDNFCIVGNIDSVSIESPYDLADESVGIISAQSEKHILENYLPNKVFIRYSSINKKIEAFNNKEINFMTLTENEFKYYYYIKEYYNLEIKYRLDEESLVATAFSQTTRGEIAAQIYNKVLSIIDKQELIDKYYDIDVNMQEVIDKERMLIAHGFLMSIIIMLIFWVRLYNGYRKSERLNKRMKNLAYTDSITGLKNSIAFYDDENWSGLLLYIDIDKFKRVNDTYGHNIGDNCLKIIADRMKLYTAGTIYDEKCEMKYCSNKQNINLYRYEKNTFIISIKGCVLSECGLRHGKELTKIIEEEISFEEKGISVNLSCSIGVAFKEKDDSCDDVIRKAHMALYLAKKKFSNKIVEASDEVFAEYERKQLIEEELSEGTILNDILPYYQPKIEMKTGKIIGVEALARWNQDKDVYLLPEEFVPLLEENNQIDVLDISILEKTIVDYMMFKEKELVDDDFRISFNFSVITLQKCDIVKILEQFHLQYGVAYTALELEITETVLSDNITLIKDKLIRISELGIKIALDDFSAGNATISRIMELPINVIKIDKALIEGRSGAKKQEIFKMMVMLCKNLGLDLIAEGAEKKSQIEFLEKVGVEFVQGFFYSEPLNITEIQKLLKKGRILKSR